MNRRHFVFHLAGGVAAVGAGSLVASCGNARPAAPDVAYQLLDGRRQRLAQQRGTVMLVNFWATSCTTCVHEMPALAATHEKFHAHGYDTLAVAMDYDDARHVANFAQTRQLPFDVAFDSRGDIARAFGEVRLTPTSFLLDKRGGIVKKYVGEPDFTALHALIAELLAEPAA